MENSSEWISPLDGLKLHQKTWRAKNARAQVVLIHGIFEHSGRYQEYAQFLQSQNIHVRSFDLRGHGQSDGKFGYFEKFDFLVEDSLAFLREVSNDSDLPVFLIGHSLGGLIASHMVPKCKEMIQGAVFSSPAIKIALEISPLMVRLSGILSAMAPTFPLLRGNPNFISSIPSEVERYKKDPLNYHGAAPTRVGAEIIAAIESVQFKLPEITSPFLVYHGTGDKITDFEGSIRLHEKSESADKTIKLWDDLRHEIHHEGVRHEMFELVSSWIHERA